MDGQVIRIAAVAALLATAPLSVAAHQLVVFASVDCEAVTVEAKFSNGRVVQQGEVRVLDADSKERVGRLRATPLTLAERVTAAEDRVSARVAARTAEDILGGAAAQQLTAVLATQPQGCCATFIFDFCCTTGLPSGRGRGFRFMLTAPHGRR